VNLVIERTPLTLKLREVLRAAGLRCEIGRPPAPTTGEQSAKLPYVILYPIEGGQGFFGPPLGNPESLGELMVQTTAVGETGHQCDAVADKVRSVLLGRSGSDYVTSLDVAASGSSSGVKVIARWSHGAGSLEVDSALVTLPERYVFGVCLP
jgi:hypothetical protein